MTYQTDPLWGTTLKSSILFMGVILLLNTGRILVGEEASVAGTLACMESTSTKVRTPVQEAEKWAQVVTGL
jgi:hypothetical protein